MNMVKGGWVRGLRAFISALFVFAAMTFVGPLVTRAAGPVVVNCDDGGNGSLRDALATANAGETITFSVDCATNNGIVLTSTLTIATDLTVDATGHTVIVDGNTSVRVFAVNSGVTATLIGLTIQHGGGFGNGAGILNNGTLTVRGSTVSHNAFNAGMGGGIVNDNGTLIVMNSTLSDNSAMSAGGIENSNGMLTVMNSTFISNTGGGSGGGIGNADTGTLVVIGSTFSNNMAQAGDGGGINNSGSLTVMNSIFSGAFTNNGGGVANSGTLTVTSSMFRSNIAGAGKGGGIYNFNGGMATVTDSTFSGNQSFFGGGIHNATGATATVTRSTFSGNRSNTFGGGIENSGGTAVVTNSTFSGNTSVGPSSAGGGIDVASGTGTVKNSTFSGNSANSGGGISNTGSLTVTNTLIAGNTAPFGNEPDAHGAITSGGHNLVGKRDGSSGWGASDLTGTAAQPVNPLLSALGNYGGPTQTFSLLPGSPAIDAGDAAVCSAAPVSGKDQRGIFRRADRCSIGSFEAAPNAPNALPAPPPTTNGNGSAPLPGTRPSGSSQPSTPAPLPPSRP